jgi:hypothetical protein
MEEHPEETLTTESSAERLALVLAEPFPAGSNEIGRWSAVLMERRARTLKAIDGIAGSSLIGDLRIVRTRSDRSCIMLHEAEHRGRSPWFENCSGAFTDEAATV